MNTNEVICTTWACNGLSYNLIDDSLFGRAFCMAIPVGLNRIQLANTMVQFSGVLIQPRDEQFASFAIDHLKERLAAVLKNQSVTLALDGGVVHKKLQCICIICNKKACFWKCFNIHSKGVNKVFPFPPRQSTFFGKSSRKSSTFDARPTAFSCFWIQKIQFRRVSIFSIQPPPYFYVKYFSCPPEWQPLKASTH